jgi:predicted N-formylglutamate amidohydrolase
MNAFQIFGADRPGPFLLTVDHASNRVPPDVCGGDLGLPPQDMARHIAWDVGALGLAQALGEALESPVIGSTFSRLVIDANRGEEDPTLVMRLYDGSIIPGNARVDQAEIDRRIATLYRPYHAALAELAQGRILLAIHSFTPCLRGRSPRPWHVGVLFSPEDPRLSRALIARLAAEPDICIGENEPYAGALPGDSIDRHALAHGRHNTLIELRNDLISDAAGQKAWAARLAPHLRAVLEDL